MLKSEASPITGHPARVNALPLSRFGRGISFRHPATVVLALLFVGACAVQILSFVLGSLLKGFFAPVRLYVGFLLGYSFLCSPPHWFRLVAGVRLGPYHRVLGVRRGFLVRLLAYGRGVVVCPMMR